MGVNILPTERWPQQQGSVRETAPRAERRKRIRTAVHWRLTLFHGNGRTAIETTTRDLSSAGLYCVANARLNVGDQVVIILEVPAHDPTGKEQSYAFRCEGRVVRVEPTSVDGAFGIACQIVDYILWRRSERPSPYAESGSPEPVS
jgi:hypothetical protein